MNKREAAIPWNWWIVLILVVITAVTYAGVLCCDYVNYDDGLYVFENPHVLSGLNQENAIWAFTNVGYMHWFPVTWLSHMAVCHFFGPDPVVPHLVNLLLHIGCVMLLFAVLWLLTERRWESAFAAALFAVHPMNVESVAWISERSNVLSVFFMLVSIAVYVGYVRHRSWLRYGGVLAAFALALMSKQQVVTLPCIFLLLDYWPLGRWSGYNGRTAWKLVKEKIPLLVMVGLASALALAANRPWMGWQYFPLPNRVGNALVATVEYLGKLFAPVHLAIFYPYPYGGPAIWKVVGAALLLVAITVVALRLARSRPYLIVGWLWFLGSLMPVNGLVQLGSHAMADRYVYIPYIGLFIACAWGLSEGARVIRLSRAFMGMLVVLVVVGLAATSMEQVRYWQNGFSLFEHAAAVTQKNWIAHQNLGWILRREGRVAEAIGHFQKSIQFVDHEDARTNLAIAYEQQEKMDDAIVNYRRALQLNPRYVDAHYNLSRLLAQRGQWDEAAGHLEEIVRLAPEDIQTHNTLGALLFTQGKIERALESYRRALQIDCANAEAIRAAGYILVLQGRIQEALSLLAQMPSGAKDMAVAHKLVGDMFVAQGKHSDALTHYAEAVRVNAAFSEARNMLEMLRREENEN